LFLEKIRVVCRWSAAELAEALITAVQSPLEQTTQALAAMTARTRNFNSHIAELSTGVMRAKGLSFSKNIRAKCSKALFVAYAKTIKEDEKAAQELAQRMYYDRESHEFDHGFRIGHHLTMFGGNNIRLSCFNIGDPSDILIAAFVANYTIEGLQPLFLRIMHATKVRWYISGSGKRTLQIVIFENLSLMPVIFSSNNGKGEQEITEIITRNASKNVAPSGGKRDATIFFTKESVSSLPAVHDFGARSIYLTLGTNLESCLRYLVTFKPTDIYFGHPSQKILLDVCRLFMCFRLDSVKHIYMPETIESILLLESNFFVFSSKCRSSVGIVKELSMDGSSTKKSSFVHYDMDLLKRLKPDIVKG